jgi:fatty-acyl-CoA synthase
MTQPTFNFADLLQLVASVVPERTAVVCGEQRLSFAELVERSLRLSRYLQREGLTAGQTVALHLGNRAEYLIGFFAACRLGCLPFNVNYRYLETELDYLYGNAGAAAAVVEPDWLPRVLGLRARPPLLLVAAVADAQDVASADGIVTFDAALQAANEMPAVSRQTSGDDPLIIYTGGTTGLPKGVVWTQGDMLMASLGGGGFFSRYGPIRAPHEIMDRVREAPHLVMFPIAPLMHGAALWAALASLFAGHTVVLSPAKNFDTAQIFDLCERERVNLLVIVGDGMGRPLADTLHTHSGRWSLSSLAFVGSGGAVFSTAVQQSLKAALPQLVINSSLGSTESGTIGGGAASVDGEGLMRFAPRPDMHVVCDASRYANPGETGILARSGPLPLGYFGDAAATARTFIELGGRRLSLTGDAARLESDGSITVLGRGSTCINSGGEKIFPEEVEQCLKQHATVSDALVVGLPDERWGERVVAVVELRAGGAIDELALREHCRGLIAGYKIPRRIVFVEQVSRTNTGKPDYSWAEKIAAAAINA